MVSFLPAAAAMAAADCCVLSFLPHHQPTVQRQLWRSARSHCGCHPRRVQAVGWLTPTRTIDLAVPRIDPATFNSRKDLVHWSPKRFALTLRRRLSTWASVRATGVSLAHVLRAVCTSRRRSTQSHGHGSEATRSGRDLGAARRRAGLSTLRGRGRRDVRPARRAPRQLQPAADLARWTTALLPVRRSANLRPHH
jgi:hypothetical protein